VEVGEAAEKGLSVFNQENKLAIEAFDRIVGSLFVKA